MSKRYECTSCGKERLGGEFYSVNKASKKDLEKNEHVTDGKLNVCKRCMALNYKIEETEKAKLLYKELDYAFSDSMWQYYIRSKINKGHDVNFKNVFGTMLSTLTMEKPIHAESDRIEKFYVTKLREQEIEMGNNLRNERLKKDYESLKKKQKVVVEQAIKKKKDELERQIFLEEKAKYSLIPKDLSKEDMKYLKGRWGGDYSPIELIKLEQEYVDLIKNGDPTDTIQVNYAKKISKISLLMDKALDEGDSGSWKDLGNLYDKLLKSADLNSKNQSTETIDSISELVAICESTGFIQIDEGIRYDQDKIDLTIDNMQSYTRDLVVSETGLTKIIKNTLEEMVYNGMITSKDLVEIMELRGEEDYFDDLKDIIKNVGLGD
jgi:hypothetical protein